MPVFWRYFLKSYIKTFLLSLIVFVCALLIMRLQEIARFASLSLQGKEVFLFILYQIPYILPFSLCISTLLASLLCMQGFSESHELTAFRCSGISLSELLFPIGLFSLFLCLLNFLVVSEIAPSCKRSSSKLLYQTATSNPLLLFRKAKFLKIKDSYVLIDMKENDSCAENLVFAFRSPSSQKLNLILAKSLYVENGSLFGKNLTLFSPLEKKEGFDDLLVENEGAMHIDSADFSSLLQKETPALRYEELSIKNLLLKKSSESHLRKSSKEAHFELSKRLFFTLSPFTFTLLGLVFGLQVGRRAKRPAAFFASCLIILLFLCYFLAKALHSHVYLSLFFFTFPHPFIFLLCLRRVKLLNQGKEL